MSSATDSSYRLGYLVEMVDAVDRWLSAMVAEAALVEKELDLTHHVQDKRDKRRGCREPCEQQPERDKRDEEREHVCP